MLLCAANEISGSPSFRVKVNVSERVALSNVLDCRGRVVLKQLRFVSSIFYFFSRQVARWAAAKAYFTMREFMYR